MSRWTDEMHRVCEQMETEANDAIGRGLTVEQFRDVAQHAYLDALRSRVRDTERDLEGRQ